MLRRPWSAAHKPGRVNLAPGDTRALGLLAWWPLDAGSVQPRDLLTGRVLTPAASGVSAQATGYGRGLGLSSGYLDSYYPPLKGLPGDGTRGFTVALAFRQVSNTGVPARLAETRGTANPFSGWIIGLDASQRLMAQTISGAGLAANALSGSAIPLGRDTVVVAVYDGSTRRWRLYTDQGRQSLTTDTQGVIGSYSDAGSPVRIGQDSYGGPARYFIGTIYDTRVWGRALSDPEAAALARDYWSMAAGRRVVVPFAAASGLDSVSCSLDLRWSLLGQVMADADLRWALLARIQADAALQWALLSAVTADSDFRWAVRGQVMADADLRWATIEHIFADADLRWAMLSRVWADADLRWALVSGLAQVAAHLDLRWSLLAQIIAGVEAQWDLLGQVVADADLRWSLAQAVATEMEARWAVLGHCAGEMDTRWSLLSRTQSTVDLRWRLGSQGVMGSLPIDVRVIPAERRVIVLPPDVRIV